jgi:hypothetical protein
MKRITLTLWILTILTFSTACNENTNVNIKKEKLEIGKEAVQKQTVFIAKGRRVLLSNVDVNKQNSVKKQPQIKTKKISTLDYACNKNASYSIKEWINHIGEALDMME